MCALFCVIFLKFCDVMLLLHFVVTLDALQVPPKLPLPRLCKTGGLLGDFRIWRGSLSKDLKILLTPLIGLSPFPPIRYHQKKNLRGDCDVCGYWRFEGPNPQAAVETLSQQPRCQRLGLLEAGKFWIFLGGLRWLAGKSTMEMKMYFLLKMWMFPMSCQFSGVQCFTKTYPSWKLTAHPWKWMVGRYMNIWHFLLRPGLF